jgi:hypothetical protein
LELLGKVRQAFKELLDHNHTKHKSLSLSPEGLNHELQGYSLKHVVQKLVLDYSSKELGNPLQIILGVLVQESILIKQAMQHTSIDLLLFDDLRLLEVPQCHDQLLDPLVHLIGCSLENLLEVLISSLVDFLCALRG